MAGRVWVNRYEVLEDLHLLGCDVKGLGTITAHQVPGASGQHTVLRS